MRPFDPFVFYLGALLIVLLIHVSWLFIFYLPYLSLLDRVDHFKVALIEAYWVELILQDLRVYLEFIDFITEDVIAIILTIENFFIFIHYLRKELEPSLVKARVNLTQGAILYELLYFFLIHTHDFQLRGCYLVVSGCLICRSVGIKL